MKKIKYVLASLALATGLLSTSAFANHHASEARVEGSMASLSWVSGVRLGEGHLMMHDQKMKFRVHGLSVLSAGLAGGEFHGKVKNLKNVADFEGTYQLAEAGVAYGLGAHVQRWENEKGVVIELHGVQVGLEARLGPGGMKVSFVEMIQRY